MKRKILTLEQGFIHDVRHILFKKGFSEHAKLLKIAEILFMYDTMKDIERIYPEVKDIIKQVIEEEEEGEAE